jgi:hypothetical protein
MADTATSAAEAAPTAAPADRLKRGPSARSVTSGRGLPTDAASPFRRSPGHQLAPGEEDDDRADDRPHDARGADPELVVGDEVAEQAAQERARKSERDGAEESRAARAALRRCLLSPSICLPMLDAPSLK